MSGTARAGTRSDLGVTAGLAAWSAGLTSDDVPLQVRTKAAQLILDGLGCALHGSTTPWGRMVGDLILESGGAEQATVWGSGTRVPAIAAPLANGTFVHSFEFDDLHAPAVLHGTAQVLPAALAVTELRTPADASSAPVPAGMPSAAEVITAAVVGFEVGARIGMATGAEQLGHGFHPSPNTGLFSSAATAARLLRLDAAATTHAFGIAASSGGFLMAAQYGAMVKRMHPGRAAQAGVLAALLAARGFTGIGAVLEEPYGGFAHAYAGLEPADTTGTLDGLGERWETLRFSVKAYPCCGSNHTTIDAYQAMLDRVRLKADDVASIDVACSTLTAEHVGWDYVPDSVTSAQMNLAYTLAALVVDGELFVDQFREERIADPRILDVVSRIRVHPEPEIDAQGREARHLVRLTVTTTDGDTYTEEVRHAHGSAQHPLSDEACREKYRRLAATVLPAPVVSDLEGAVLALASEAASTEPVARILEALSRRPLLPSPTTTARIDER